MLEHWDSYGQDQLKDDGQHTLRETHTCVRQYCPAASGLLQGWLRGMLACNMRVFSFTPAMVVTSTLRAERDVRLKMPQSVHALGARHVHCASTTCVCPSLYDVMVQGFAIQITPRTAPLYRIRRM